MTIKFKIFYFYTVKSSCVYLKEPAESPELFQCYVVRKEGGGFNTFEEAEETVGKLISSLKPEYAEAISFVILTVYVV